VEALEKKIPHTPKAVLEQAWCFQDSIRAYETLAKKDILLQQGCVHKGFLWALGITLSFPKSSSMAPGHPGCGLEASGTIHPTFRKKKALPNQGAGICQDCRIRHQTLEIKHSAVKGDGKMKSPGKS